VAVAVADITVSLLEVQVVMEEVQVAAIKMPAHRGMSTVSINKLVEFMPMPDKTIPEVAVVAVATADQIHTD
jgi:hypothetical protein